jgi:hypothetical protein
MFARSWTDDADLNAVARAGGFGIRLITVVLVAAPIVGGCAAPPASVVAGPDPANPQSRVARVGYQSVTGSYVSRRPVAPAPWSEQNERVAPPPRSGQ